MKTVTLKAFTKKLDNFANGKAIEEAVTKSCLLVEKESLPCSNRYFKTFYYN